MADEPYRPIDCAVYSGYELAIMRRRRLKVHWRDAHGNDHVAVLSPQDLRTEPSKEEFMLARDVHGTSVRVRLDRIVRCDPLDETEYESR